MEDLEEPADSANRAEKRRILKSESALRLTGFARRAVVGRIRFSESAAFRPGWLTRRVVVSAQRAVGSGQSAVLFPLDGFRGMS